TLMAAACGCCRWRASRPGNCPKKTIITMATAMRTAKTEKAIASRTPKVDSTAEAPFFEFQASDLGWCREIGWNPERQALTYLSSTEEIVAEPSAKGHRPKKNYAGF